jgi:hypothetical protein
MKGLFKLFIVVFVLVFLVPLVWCLIKELIFFVGNLFGGMAVTMDNVGYLAFIAVCVVLIIIFLKIIFD